MKYCTKCGAQLFDEAVICVRCGCPTAPIQTAQDMSSVQGGSSISKTIAFVLMIISTVVSGFLFIISLAWMIPLTVIYNQKVRCGEPLSTGFKVCILIFVNIVAGILLLCDSD